VKYHQRKATIMPNNQPCVPVVPTTRGYWPHIWRWVRSNWRCRSEQQTPLSRWSPSHIWVLEGIVPSGKHTKNDGKSPCYSWVNPLWPFSMAMLVYHRVSILFPWQVILTPGHTSFGVLGWWVSGWRSSDRVHMCTVHRHMFKWGALNSPLLYPI